MLVRAKVLTAPDDDMGDGIRAAGPNPRLCVQVAAAEDAHHPATLPMGQGLLCLSNAEHLPCHPPHTHTPPCCALPVSLFPRLPYASSYPVPCSFRTPDAHPSSDCFELKSTFIGLGENPDKILSSRFFGLQPPMHSPAIPIPHTQHRANTQRTHLICTRAASAHLHSINRDLATRLWL